MAGTGLARKAPAFTRFTWANLLPVVARLMPDTSTPDRSAKAAAWIMNYNEVKKKTGIIFSYDCRPY
jgi:hypothetical protein